MAVSETESVADSRTQTQTATRHVSGTAVLLSSPTERCSQPGVLSAPQTLSFVTFHAACVFHRCVEQPTGSVIHCPNACAPVRPLL